MELENREIQEEAKNIVDMGFSMIETIIQVKENLKSIYKLDDFNELNMRIGIHTVKIYIIYFLDFFKF